MRVTHDDGTIDNRYTFGKEFCGYSTPMIAVRFCGDLIGFCRDENKAQHVADTHKKGRAV